MKIFIYLSLLFMTACTVEKQEPTIFVQNVYQQDIVWKSFPIKFNFHKSVPDHLKKIIATEMKQFNLIYGKTVFILDTKDVTTGFENRDKKNTIYLNDVRELDKSEQAKTSVSWGGDEILEADVFFNVDYFKNGYDLHTLTRHELMHVLGLKHLEDGSLMAKELPKHTVRSWDFKLINMVHQKMSGNKLVVGSNE